MRSDSSANLFSEPFTALHHYEPPRLFLGRTWGHAKPSGGLNTFGESQHLNSIPTARKVAQVSCNPPHSAKAVWIRRRVIYALISSSLVWLGSHAILSRHSGGSSEQLMDIPTGGSAEYIAMAQHGTMAGPAPFRYRFVVPLIVSALPVSAELGFRIVTFTCLGLTYIVASFIAEALGISLPGALIALLSVFCARTHAYNLLEPAAGRWLGIVGLVRYGVGSHSRPVMIFTVASVLGTLGRESVMFLTPAIFTRAQWKRAILPIFLTALAYVLPRVLLRTPDQDIVHFYAEYHPLAKFVTFQFWKSVAMAWGAICG